MGPKQPHHVTHLFQICIHHWNACLEHNQPYTCCVWRKCPCPPTELYIMAQQLPPGLCQEHHATRKGGASVGLLGDESPPPPCWPRPHACHAIEACCRVGARWENAHCKDAGRQAQTQHLPRALLPDPPSRPLPYARPPPPTPTAHQCMQTKTTAHTRAPTSLPLPPGAAPNLGVFHGVCRAQHAGQGCSTGYDGAAGTPQRPGRYVWKASSIWLPSAGGKRLR